MRPRKLRMVGLRSYRAERTVNFTDLSLVAIIGPTGAGKSSVLEGITYALYGASTWDRKAVKVLIADAALSMTVSLEFEADGEVWEITRVIPRSGPASHKLICLSDPAVAKVDGDAAVNERIERLIGLDYRGFCSCVLLPQGKFEQLLKATPKVRASILKGILRLDELDLMRERALELAGRLTPRCEEIQHARAQFLPDPALTHEQAAAKEDELRPIREQLERAKTIVDTLIEQVTEHRRIAQDADAAAKRVHELLDLELIDRLRTLGELDRELATAHAAAIQTSAKADEAVAAAERKVTKLRKDEKDSATISSARNTLTSALEDLSTIDEEEQELATARVGLNADQETHTAETARLVALGVTAAELEGDVNQRHDNLMSATETYNAAVAQITTIVAAREALQSARDAERNAGQQHSAKLAACQAAAAELKQAQVASAKARAALAVGQRADLTAQLAHDCKAGDRCPVCARALPDAFVAPVLSDEAHALQDATGRAEQAEQELRRAASVADGEAVIAERELQAAAELLATSTATWEAELSHALPDGLAAETVELDASTTERLQAPLRLAGEQRESAQVELKRIRDEQTGLKATCTAAATELERRATRLAAQAESLERRRATVNARLAQLPSWIKLAEPRDRAAFDAAADLLGAQFIEAETSEREAAAANELLTVATKAVRAIEERVRDEVRDPARVERTAIESLRAELARQQILVPTAPAESAGIAEQIKWANLVIDGGVREHQRLRELAESHDDAATRDTAAGRDTVTALGFDDSRALQDALIETIAQEISARRQREQAAAQMQPTAELDALFAKSKGLRDGLGELGRQLADAKFVGFVVERRQRSLLMAASGILSQMTAGQFGFTEDFQIIDRRSDMARSPDTLSGGETFLASLALALGLVELAGRSGGRLQALFLDEGFGSLDPDALENALNELEQRAQAGRLIALISHVPAIAERIDQILRVTKTPQGSDIHLLTDAERQALLLDDAAETTFAPQ